jgi:hypothetical protein
MTACVLYFFSKVAGAHFSSRTLACYKGVVTAKCLDSRVLLNLMTVRVALSIGVC